MRKNESCMKVAQQGGDIFQALALHDLILLPLSSSIIKRLLLLLLL